MEARHAAHPHDVRNARIALEDQIFHPYKRAVVVVNFLPTRMRDRTERGERPASE